MARLTDIIENFLKDMLNDNDGYVELKRNELANSFNCSPSQINYVLETRFQPQMGYYIESRRGGGGYISIERVKINLNDEFEDLLTDAIGDSITLNEVDAIVNSLLDSDLISKRESAIILASVSDRSLDSSLVDRNKLRASILRNLLLVVARENDYE